MTEVTTNRSRSRSRGEAMTKPAALECVLRALPLALAVSACTPPAVAAREGSSPERADREVVTMKVRIVIRGKAATATLVDNETSRDFLSLLPLKLTLKDYASTEKVSDLPRKLTTKGSPAGVDPSPGDIAYYAPWGNLAIYYRDFGYSRGLVKLGKLDTGFDAFKGEAPLEVTIERMN